MSVLNEPHFQNEAAAFAKLESIIWPNGPVCHHCGATDRIYALNGVRSKPSKKNPVGFVRHGLKKCGHCRKQFTACMGTVFESGHLPLHLWLQAAHLLCSSNKGISSHRLHRVLKVTYQAAWFSSHRLRDAVWFARPDGRRWRQRNYRGGGNIYRAQKMPTQEACLSPQERCIVAR